MKNLGTKQTTESCRKARLAIRDTLDVVGGKWKLVLISILRDEKMRFKELSREAGISPRILSKELKELEAYGLVNRKVCDTRPITVEYSLTPYSETLSEVLLAMHKWGMQHRKKFIGKQIFVENHDRSNSGKVLLGLQILASEWGKKRLREIYFTMILKRS